MKRVLLIGAIMLACSVTNGQNRGDHGRVNRLSVFVPDSLSRSASSLASYIRNRYKSPEQQIQALYSWVTANIRYDEDSSFYLNRALDHEAKIAALLRRRKGVCEGYAGLFADLTSKIELRSYVVYGYPAGVNTRGMTGHAWCAVELDGDWWLFDPTWDAAGQQGEFQYFMVAPSSFISTHIPFDPLWQLLEKPVGYRNSFSGKKESLHYKDSVNAFLQMDSLQQYLSIERRMKNAGATHEMFKLWQTYNRMNIAIIAGEQDMQLYNSAVDDLNRATEIFNAFVQYRNSGFQPSKPDDLMRKMLDPIEALIANAHNKIDGMGKLVENFQYNPEAIRKKLLALAVRSEEQKKFLKKYLAAGPLERPELFYKQNGN